MRRIVLSTIYLGMLALGLCFSIITPFASDMVMTLGMTSDKNKTGYWVGMMSSFLMLGRILSSSIWGYIIDTKGRKLVTQIALISLVTLSIALGLSFDYIFTVIVRFLTGFMIPLMVSSRTIIGELCEGEELSSAMAWLGIMLNLGALGGNFVGGILANPVDKGIIGLEVFQQFPYLLPCLFPAIVGLIALILGQIYLRETLSTDKELLLINNYEDRSLVSIAFDSRVFPCLFANFIIGLTYTSFQELLTLLAWAKQENGGVEMTETEIGSFIGITYCIMLAYQKPFYSLLAKYYGNLHLAQSLFIIAMPFTIGVPLICLIDNTIIRYIFLMILCCGFFTIDFLLYVSVNVLINNSVPSRELGRLNGLIMTIVSISRFLASWIFGSIFAWTIDSWLPSPLNSCFSYLLIIIFQFLGLYYTHKILRENENKYSSIIS